MYSAPYLGECFSVWLASLPAVRRGAREEEVVERVVEQVPEVVPSHLDANLLGHVHEVQVRHVPEERHDLVP